MGLRDRALIGLMVFTFARVGAAAIEMKVEDCFIQGRRGWVRLHEKGGKSLSATELVLEPQEGQPEVSVRGEEGPLPFPQVIAPVEFFHLSARSWSALWKRFITP